MPDVPGKSRVQAWSEDVEFLRQELPNRHPNLFFHLPREEFDAKLNGLINDLGEMSDFGVVMRMREIIATIGDPHTNFGFYDLLDEGGLFPINLYWFSDGLYVVGVHPSAAALMGKRLTSINGVEIDTVLTKISPIVPEIEPYFREKRLPDFVRFQRILKHYGILDERSAIFAVQTESGQNSELRLSPVVAEDDEFEPLMVQYQAEVKPYYWFKYESDKTKEQSIFRERHFPRDGIYFVQYNSCWGRELEKQYGSSEKANRYPSFLDFKRQVLSTLQNDSVKKLIVDLRFNGGGSSPQGTELVEQIAKIGKINKRGCLFVAISPETFSSAVINAMDFRLKTKATLLGRPAGGRPNHYGEVRGLELPNSKLTVYHSTKYFEYTEEEFSAVEPDVVIENRFSDFNIGIDPVRVCQVC